MLSLLERNIAAIEHRLILLAPPSATVPDTFSKIAVNPREHHRLVQQMQRLRGAVYLDDGAVEHAQLAPGGLHQTPEDARSWHLLMLNANGDVNSCIWYCEHEGVQSIDELRARKCPLNTDVAYGDTFRRAVHQELDRARLEGLGYAEIGGWAVAKDSRCTAEGLVLALGAYSLGQTVGPALGLTTATERHSSSTILRRLGGSSLHVGGEAVPTYYDPHYQCNMEVLRFDSRRPSAKYVGLVNRLQERLQTVKVIAARVPDVRASREACAA